MIRRRKVATDKLLLNFYLETDTDSYNTEFKCCFILGSKLLFGLYDKITR